MAEALQLVPQRLGGPAARRSAHALVTDAGGVVGAQLVERLVAHGWPVRGVIDAGVPTAGAGASLQASRRPGGQAATEPSQQARDAAAPADTEFAGPETLVLASWPDTAAAFAELLDGVDVLLLPDLAAVDWSISAGSTGAGTATGPTALSRRLTRLEAVIAAAKAAGVARVVLLSPAEAYGPAAVLAGAVDETAAFPGADVSPETPLARAAALETLLRHGPGTTDVVVLRTLEVMGGAESDLLQQVGAVLDRVATGWPRDRLHGIAAADLAEAMLCAAQGRSDGGAALNLAAPAAVAGDAAVEVIVHLAEALSDLARTEVWQRPSYPSVPPVLDTTRAAAVLPVRPTITLWNCLAELVQAQVQQRRRVGLLPPAMPRMPAALVAIETGARPLEGRVAVITGATAGIGQATTRLLARLGAQVVGVGRNAAAGAALCAEIDKIGTAPARFIVADLVEMDEVRGLANTLCADFPRIDLLINNAGAVFPERGESTEGNERTLALNLLAPLLLTRLLADPLIAAGGQVINVTSEAHRNWPVDLGDLQATFDFRPMAAYGRAKSGLILITYALAELARDSGVRFNAINPGAVRTEILTSLGDGMETAGLGPQAVQRIEARRERMRQQLISPGQAALHVVNLVADPDWAEAQGVYLDKDAAVASAAHTCDRETAEGLWLLCADLTGLEP